MATKLWVGDAMYLVDDEVYDVLPAHELKATKMSDFLKKKGSKSRDFGS